MPGSFGRVKRGASASFPRHVGLADSRAPDPAASAGDAPDVVPRARRALLSAGKGSIRRNLGITICVGRYVRKGEASCRNCACVSSPGLTRCGLAACALRFARWPNRGVRGVPRFNVQRRLNSPARRPQAGPASRTRRQPRRPGNNSRNAQATLVHGRKFPLIVQTRADEGDSEHHALSCPACGQLLAT